ncbi:MAG: hypothetical protein ABIB98_01100 [bacterium]
MRKRFLLILYLFIVISLVVAGSTYFFLWQKEKAKQEAFTTPTPSKDINWVVNENVIEKEALYIKDNQNVSYSKPVELRGTEYSFTEVVENENERYSQPATNSSFTGFDYDWFDGHGWYKNVTLNERYSAHSNDAVGVLGYTESYFKILGGNLRVVALRKDIENTVEEVSGPPFPEYKLNYPFHMWYKVFISEIVPIKSIIPEL